MRKLNSKQKELLKQLANQGIKSIYLMDNNHLEKLEKLNDYETLFDDADRYLNDYRLSEI